MLIFLPCGGIGLISEEDADLLKYTWFLNHKRGYISHCSTKYGNLVLHKLIAKRMGIMSEIDHEDRNKLNCQRTNLRPCTRTQNNANNGFRKDNTTTYRGVGFCKKNNKFRARIRINKREKFLGYFDDPSEAARVYDKAAIHYFGEFATLNGV